MIWKRWLPHATTLLLAALLVVTQQVWAGPLAARLTSAMTVSSKTTINYQGYLTDSSGNPVNDTLNMVFRLYRNESDTVADAIWTETQNGVTVRDGLFSVLLGSVTDIQTSDIANNDNLWLGIVVGGDAEMSPREKIASSPYAMLANVPDGSITSVKLADNAVTSAKIQDGQVSSSDVGFNYAASSSKGGPASSVACSNCISSGEIQDGQVTTADLGNNAVTSAKIADGTVTQAKAPTLARAKSRGSDNVKIEVFTVTCNSAGGCDYWFTVGFTETPMVLKSAFDHLDISDYGPNPTNSQALHAVSQGNSTHTLMAIGR